MHYSVDQRRIWTPAKWVVMFVFFLQNQSPFLFQFSDLYILHKLEAWILKICLCSHLQIIESAESGPFPLTCFPLRSGPTWYMRPIRHADWGDANVRYLFSVHPVSVDRTHKAFASFDNSVFEANSIVILPKGGCLKAISWSSISLCICSRPGGQSRYRFRQ